MRDIQKEIQDRLDAIEKEHHVRILLAIESGSRAWGFASPDSDYDVRFIYVRPAEDYLRIDSLKDTIEWQLDEVLDINGWDLIKALTAFAKGNPNVMEWATSPIVYRKADEWDEICDVAKTYFSEKAALCHYYGTANSTYQGFLIGDQVRYKKYFYALRPLLCCRWIERYHTVPPMRFGELLKLFDDPEVSFPDGLRQAVMDLLERKAITEEKDLNPHMPAIRDFIETECLKQKKISDSAPDDHKQDFAALNEVFRKTVMSPTIKMTVPTAPECFMPEIHLEKALEELKKRKKDILRYTEIMQLVHRVDVSQDQDFQRKYNAFYRVRRDASWRQVYFRLMEDNKYKTGVEPSFGEIQLRLFLETGQVESSFASKMLATLNPQMPIWDSRVLHNLQLKLKGKTPEQRLSSAVVLYDRICEWYEAFLQTDKAREILKTFDEALPECKTFSDVKKLDFVLWANE